jgi:hypothetical protein
MGRNEINDYVIYKIVCLSNPDLVYVGSTANFYARRKCHIKCCNNPNNKEYNHKKYVAIRENGGWDNWNMVVVDELKHLTLIKSLMVEEEWRVKLNANLNTNKCFISDEEEVKRKKEYYQNNKDAIREHEKEYYQKNKDSISEKKKEYREKNKDILKEYYHNRKEIILEHKKEYYIKNKEMLLEKGSEKITCVCGCVTRKDTLTRHMKTQKHLNLLAQQTTEVN